MTLVELIVMLAILSILGALLLSRLARPNRRSAKIGCTNNLKQIGLGFQIFANDHNDLYPTLLWPPSEVPVGSAHYAAWIYRALSNEISTPRVVVCPDDSRKPATNFATFGTSNLSYFVGTRLDRNYPQSPLAGDRDLTVDGRKVKPGFVSLKTNHVFGWSGSIHKHGGNIVQVDGRIIRTFAGPPMAPYDALSPAPAGAEKPEIWLAIP